MGEPRGSQGGGGENADQENAKNEEETHSEWKRMFFCNKTATRRKYLYIMQRGYK